MLVLYISFQNRQEFFSTISRNPGGERPPHTSFSFQFSFQFSGFPSKNSRLRKKTPTTRASMIREKIPFCVPTRIASRVRAEAMHAPKQCSPPPRPGKPFLCWLWAAGGEFLKDEGERKDVDWLVGRGGREISLHLFCLGICVVIGLVGSFFG